MVDPNLKDAVWQVLEEYARFDPSKSLHSDLIIRKFPQVNELELINAIGELLEDGKITAKASAVDAHGNASAYHIRVRGVKERPGASKAPRAGIGEVNVGFTGTPDLPSPQADRKPEPPAGDDTAERPSVSVEGEKTAAGPAQAEAEQNFADEAASFFAELALAETNDLDAKKELIDQLTVLAAMFQSADAQSFTIPINKLAALKDRVRDVTPELVGDYILLMQTALRAWLGRV